MTTCSVRYESHLSDKARSSEASRFSITKIWYAYALEVLHRLNQQLGNLFNFHCKCNPLLKISFAFFEISNSKFTLAWTLFSPHFVQKSLTSAKLLRRYVCWSSRLRWEQTPKTNADWDARRGSAGVCEAVLRVFLGGLLKWKLW